MKEELKKIKEKMEEALKGWGKKERRRKDGGTKNVERTREE